MDNLSFRFSISIFSSIVKAAKSETWQAFEDKFRSQIGFARSLSATPRSGAFAAVERGLEGGAGGRVELSRRDAPGMEQSSFEQNAELWYMENGISL